MDAIRALQQQLMEARRWLAARAKPLEGPEDVPLTPWGKKQVFSLREFLDFDFLGLDHVSDKRNV